MDKSIVLGNFLCDKLMKETKKGFYQPLINFYTNFNVRIEDEINSNVNYGVETQYGDFFIILPYNLDYSDLSIINLLLTEPYNCNMYVSNCDNRMQIRISGYVVERMYNKNKKLEL